MIIFGRDICTDLKGSTSHEWLETNGIGGYASSTVSGAHTRRYHGLLVAATRPPLGRMVLLSKFEEAVLIDGERFDISCSRYPGAVYPEGYRFISEFRLDPFPVWTYSIGGLLLERSLFAVHAENSVAICWSIIGKGVADVHLELKPLVAFRDHHHLRRETDNAFSTVVEQDGRMVRVRHTSKGPVLFINSNAASAEASGHWYRNFEYTIEEERGFDFHEDLFQPVKLRFDLNQDAYLIASDQERDAARLEEYRAAEIDRRASVIKAAGEGDEFTQQLALAADQFIVDRGSGKTVIAGYHWFSDWGRDTMIALPGLSLAAGRPEIARSVLLEFAKHISEGMIPNRFPDEGETPDYNTVDATLWFFEAIRAYTAATGKFDLFDDDLYEKLVDIIDNHVRGTRFGIHVDTDGLLFAGEEGTQLTWMDAKVGEWVVTPRIGKPVEIQALWYNSLCIMSELAESLSDDVRASTYASMAHAAKASFNGQFWNEAVGCLYDVVANGDKDGSIRPNQIFAVSLPHTMLSPERAGRVVAKVESELLTPYGLRSLSPGDPRYVGRYQGDPMARDGAYHQGTVWAWLIGPFIDAYRRVNNGDEGAKARMAEMLSAFRGHLTEAGVGQVSEIFDGDPPHHPRGCAAQAWSVAELLRVIKKV